MSAGYDPELPGLDEARLDGYRDLIISKIGLLNTALGRDGLREMGEITPAMVEIGDSETAWDLATGPVRIRIVAGGDEDGLDFQARLGMGLTGNTGYAYDFTTNIFVYLHPDAMANDDATQQTEDRERVRSRIADWITLGVCNNWDPATETGGAVVPLKSRIMTAAPGFDSLLENTLRRAYKQWLSKSFGGDICFPCLHLVITACIE